MRFKCDYVLVYMHVHECIFKCMSKHLCVYVCMCVYMDMYAYVSMCVRVWGLCVCIFKGKEFLM